MTPALRWASMRAILMFINCEGQSHKTTVSTHHNFWRQRRAEADSNRGPSAYALPLSQTGSLYISCFCVWIYRLSWPPFFLISWPAFAMRKVITESLKAVFFSNFKVVYCHAHYAHISSGIGSSTTVCEWRHTQDKKEGYGGSCGRKTVLIHLKFLQINPK